MNDMTEVILHSEKIDAPADQIVNHRQHEPKQPEFKLNLSKFIKAAQDAEWLRQMTD